MFFMEGGIMKPSSIRDIVYSLDIYNRRLLHFSFAEHYILCIECLPNSISANGEISLIVPV